MKSYDSWLVKGGDGWLNVSDHRHCLVCAWYAPDPLYMPVHDPLRQGEQCSGIRVNGRCDKCGKTLGNIRQQAKYVPHLAEEHR